MYVQTVKALLFQQYYYKTFSKVQLSELPILQTSKDMSRSYGNPTFTLYDIVLNSQSVVILLFHIVKLCNYKNFKGKYLKNFF